MLINEIQYKSATPMKLNEDSQPGKNIKNTASSVLYFGRSSKVGPVL
jgi:hypothetical protein